MEAERACHGVSGAYGGAAVATLPVPGYGALLPPICLIGLDQAPFLASDFAAYGIACPPQIRNSVARRQKEFFYGRVAARHSLAMLGAGAAEIAIGAMREPLWPAGVVGSISHNQAYAAAVTARRARFSSVGIDIESVASAENQEAMQALVVSAGELAYLKSVDCALPLATVLTIVFSAKESFYKAAYADVGRFFDFCDAQVSEFDPGRSALVLTLQTGLSAQFTCGKQCRVHYALVDPHTVITAYAC